MQLTCNGCCVGPTAEHWSRSITLSTPITNTPIAKPEGPAGVLNLLIRPSSIYYIGSIQYTFDRLLRPGPLEAIPVMVTLPAVNPLSPIDEEKRICHHTPTLVITPIDKPFGHHCDARISGKEYTAIQP